MKPALFPRPTARDLAGWYMNLSQFRRRVTDRLGEMHPSFHLASVRYVNIAHAAFEAMDQYRPLSDQRWEALKFKALTRSVSCTACNGRKRIRINGRRAMCPSCSGSGLRDEGPVTIISQLQAYRTVA